MTKLSNPLLSLLEKAASNRWCTRYACTTCGAHDFRCELQRLSTSEVITALGALDNGEFYDHYGLIKDLFRWLRHEFYITSPDDLESIRGSVAWNYYVGEHLAYKIAREESNIKRLKDEERQSVSRKMRAQKASYDLPKAVARGDIKAVKGLLRKGADPDYDQGPGVNTARQTAKLWGREHYFVDELIDQ